MNNEFLNSERENEKKPKKHKKFRIMDIFAYLLCLLISLGIWAYVVSVENDNYEYTVPYTTRPYTPPTTVPYNPVYEAMTGNVMCIVTEPYADTRPLVYNDDTYMPA